MLNAIFIQSRDLVILIAYPITGWQCFMAVNIVKRTRKVVSQVWWEKNDFIAGSMAEELLNLKLNTAWLCGGVWYQSWDVGLNWSLFNQNGRHKFREESLKLQHIPFIYNNKLQKANFLIRNQEESLYTYIPNMITKLFFPKILPS